MQGMFIAALAVLRRRIEISELSFELDIFNKNGTQRPAHVTVRARQDFVYGTIKRIVFHHPNNPGVALWFRWISPPGCEV
ncbi:MAG: hypothetical protein JWP25_146 [Bradyrhizobium sp.]|jgi:hypothetical protein|nr:hypothetical protein [Bradyrhizobium sp.]